MEGILKLSVEDRILIYGLQPEKGPYELLASFRLLEKDLRFTEEETRNYDIKNVPAPDVPGKMMVAFNKEVARGHLKDIKMPARILSYLSEKLEEMDTEGELTFQLVEIYEKICLGKKEDGTNAGKQSKSNNSK
jgi:hypothetical protein